MQVDLCRQQSGNFHGRRQAQQLVNTLKTFPSYCCNTDRGKHLGAGFCSQDYNCAADSTSPWTWSVVFVIWSPAGMKSIAACLFACCMTELKLGSGSSTLGRFCPNSVLGDLQKNSLGSVESPTLAMSYWKGCTSALLLTCCKPRARSFTGLFLIYF